MTKRITGGQLQRIRKQVFDEQPLCVMCKAKAKAERVRLEEFRKSKKALLIA